MNTSDIHQPSNIYVPGLPGLNVPERTPDSRNLYTDREVSLLPHLRASHSHYREMNGRAASSDRLIRYLTLRKKEAGILEIGCGNGWLSHRLAAVPGSRVIGLDPNLGELRQAARVFRRQPNLKFIYGDLYSGILQDLSFDVIVMAACRLSSVPGLIRDALPYLRPHGELHLLDTPIRRPLLHEFRHRVLYDPGAFWNRLLRKDQFHPWICIGAPPASA